MLKKNFIRDGRRQILGSVTTGFIDSSSVVRDKDNKILGRTSELFSTTRNREGNLVSANTSDAGMLIRTTK